MTVGKLLAGSCLGASLALLLWSQGIAATAASDTEPLDRLFERSTLQIAASDAQLHTFKIWIADNNARRQRGLMFVKHLDPDAGMLFIYDEPQPISMWMKNTKISLDMLFVAANGRVTRVAEHTEPESLTTIESGGDVTAVVELNAGTAARLHIKAGSQVIHPAFAL